MDCSRYERVTHMRCSGCCSHMNPRLLNVFRSPLITRLASHAILLSFFSMIIIIIVIVCGLHLGRVPSGTSTFFLFEIMNSHCDGPFLVLLVLIYACYVYYVHARVCEYFVNALGGGNQCRMDIYVLLSVYYRIYQYNHDL